MHRVIHGLTAALGLLLILVGPAPVQDVSAQAQDQCGELDIITYPIDRNMFQLSQNFGTASPRHQGRYHTGEDWFAGYGATLGQPVRAVGRGLVTFSSPNAWGVDGGVVIIRHTLADGSFVYSQYGHMMETNTVLFPRRLTCVESGQVIGVIGDARPNPHLHFEMRVFTNQNPGIADTAGPGYTRTDPTLLGWRRPDKTITNLQAQLSRAYLWHTTLAQSDRQTAPLTLNDNSLLVIDGDRLRRVTSDGRILWRVTLDGRAVNLHGFQANSFVTYDDGRIVQVDVESGAFGASTDLDIAPSRPPLPVDDQFLYPLQNGSVALVNMEHTEVIWQLADVPAFEYGVVTPQLIGLEIDNELWTISREGRLLDRAGLADGVALAPHPEGTLLAYTSGGAWTIDASGEWSILIEDVPPGGRSHGIAMSVDGTIFLSDGEAISVYTPTQELAWQARLPQIMNGRITMRIDDTVLLMIGGHGDLAALRTTGGICGFTRVFSDDNTPMWVEQGDDNVLRVASGDQIIGFDWERFTNGC